MQKPSVRNEERPLFTVTKKGTKKIKYHDTSLPISPALQRGHFPPPPSHGPTPGRWDRGRQLLRVIWHQPAPWDTRRVGDRSAQLRAPPSPSCSPTTGTSEEKASRLVKWGWARLGVLHMAADLSTKEGRLAGCAPQHGPCSLAEGFGISAYLGGSGLALSWGGEDARGHPRVNQSTVLGQRQDRLSPALGLWGGTCGLCGAWGCSCSRLRWQEAPASPSGTAGCGEEVEHWWGASHPRTPTDPPLPREDPSPAHQLPG